MTAVETIRCGDWLRLSAQRFPDRDCVVTDERRFTFREVNARVNRLAEALNARGAGVGTRIALLASNSHGYLETLLASMQLGATYVPLNFRLAPPEVENLLHRSAATILFVEARPWATVAAMRERLPDLEFVVCYDDELGDTDYESFLATGTDPNFDADAAIDDDTILGLCFTSGTTALPKGVMHSQRMTKTLTYQTIIERRLPADAFHYSPAPLFHVAGMVYAYAGISRGHTSLIMDFEPTRILRWMQHGGLTGCFFVPTMISTLLHTEGVRDSSYDQLESIAYGASPMTPGLLRRAINTFGCDFINMFGAGTEAGLRDDSHAGGPSKGTRRSGASVELDRPTSVERRRAILRRADPRRRRRAGRRNRDPERRRHDRLSRHARADRRGSRRRLVPRRRSRLDGSARIYSVGRPGEGHDHPRWRERLPHRDRGRSRRLVGITEVAVVGAPDDHWGEIVRAHVVLESGSAFDEDAAAAFCRQRMAGYKVPANFVSRVSCRRMRAARC